MVAVQLAHHLEGRVHAQHGHTGVQRGNVAVGHVLCHGAAASGVHLAQLADLPAHARRVQHGADVAHRLRRRVGRAGFAPRTGVLADTHAAVDKGRVLLLVHLGKIGVIGRRHVGGQAEGVLIAYAQGHALPIAQVGHKGVEGRGLHARHTRRPSVRRRVASTAPTMTGLSRVRPTVAVWRGRLLPRGWWWSRATW